MSRRKVAVAAGFFPRYSVIKFFSVKFYEEKTHNIYFQFTLLFGVNILLVERFKK
jgi:hypothetical protein